MDRKRDKTPYESFCVSESIDRDSALRLILKIEHPLLIHWYGRFTMKYRPGMTFKQLRFKWYNSMAHHRKKKQHERA